MLWSGRLEKTKKSLPSWERGLKSECHARNEVRALVAPFVGAWIEIQYKSTATLNYTAVAPFVGAWIEINKDLYNHRQQLVAPFVGAWIEIDWGKALCAAEGSLPSWERGLKFAILTFPSKHFLSRSLRGSVD